MPVVAPLTAFVPESHAVSERFSDGSFLILVQEDSVDWLASARSHHQS